MTRLPNPTPSISLHAKLPLHHCGRAFRKEQQPVHPHALQQLQPRIPPSSKCDPSAPLVSQSSVAITFHLLTSIIIVLAVVSRHLLTTCPRLFQSDSCIRHSPRQARLLDVMLHTSCCIRHVAHIFVIHCMGGSWRGGHLWSGIGGSLSPRKHLGPSMPCV